MNRLSLPIRNFASQILPHDNQRCVAPPGKISPAVGKPIIICSFMRTGTHLLIDLILNHFPCYRRSPLYINLDRYVHQVPNALENLNRCGNYILKTHYPEYPSAHQAMSHIIANSYIIRTHRDEKDNYQSLQNFTYPHSFSEFQNRKTSWEKFWQTHTTNVITFSELIDRRRYRDTVNKVAHMIEQEVPARIIYPPHRRQTLQALWDKLRTRVLGKRAPKINTTIQFATTKKSTSK